MHRYVQRETDSYKSHDFFSESHHDYIVKCIFVYYIDVGNFSILGGGGRPDPARPTSIRVGGCIAKSTYTHEYTCMHLHVLNIHTPMHACTHMYACMHSLCKHTFYIVI